MKIADSPRFNRQFPEAYKWNLVDNITASNVSCDIVERITAELRKPIGERVAAPGLRAALCIIAEYADEI
jgi:hypothetical protein